MYIHCILQCALLLKHKVLETADDLVQVLSPAEKATALLGAQSYVTLAFVLSIVLSLIKYLVKEEAEAADKQRAVKIDIKKFCATLSLEFKKSFDSIPSIQ